MRGKKALQKRMKTEELGKSLHTQQNAPVLCSKAVYICYDRLFSFSKAMFHKLFFSYNRFYLVENRFLSDENFFFLLFWHFTRLHVNLTRNAVFSLCHFFSILFSSLYLLHKLVRRMLVHFCCCTR